MKKKKAVGIRGLLTYPQWDEKVGAVYSDADVCRLLGWRRRRLAEARKKGARGTVWACVGCRCGMLEGWLKEQLGAKKNTARPMEADGGLVSVRVRQRPLNTRIVLCERLWDGVLVSVRVRDSSLFLLGDEFDAQQDRSGLFYAGHWPERGY